MESIGRWHGCGGGDRDIGSRSLALSANRGCELCSILHQGIVAFRQYTASLLHPWKPWDLGGPCTVGIRLRRGRSLSLFLRKAGHEWKESGADYVARRRLRSHPPLGRENYEICLEYFSSVGVLPPSWDYEITIPSS